jgi:hypothetical protein
MTTEIAVSNRLGIALATDSAVTIGRGGAVKVFDTADKLFELSSLHPVAVMINGNMECLGVPWEILAKDFRRAEGPKPRASVKEWTQDFLTYVEGHLLISEEAIARYVERVATKEIEVVQTRVSNLLFNHIFETSRRDLAKDGVTRGPKFEGFDIQKVLLQTIGQRRQYLEDFPVVEVLKDITSEQITTAYSEKIRALLVEKFSGTKLTDEEVSGLEGLIVESLRRAVPSELGSGIIVAGFGTDDMYPCLHTVEVDGRVLGKLKVTALRSENIARSLDGGQVIYFAQTDVIERLLSGADPRFIGATAEFIGRAVVQVAEAVEKALRPKTAGKRSAKRQQLLDEIVELVTTEYQEETTKTLREEFSREFDRMVAMMPKQELIEFAEALVSITAVERKATSDVGTVGGPIDVAFITKHEGFVWIKRKHYFNKDFNPRYFWREYGAPPTGSAS